MPQKKIVKITAGWAGPDIICSRLAERGVKNTAGGSVGMGRALTCFAPEPSSLQRGE